jgi:hypothetical protein
MLIDLEHRLSLRFINLFLFGSKTLLVIELGRWLLLEIAAIALWDGLLIFVIECIL